jgi:hypothetical protein
MDLNLEICRALKIDTKNVMKVVITLLPSQKPTIEVTRYVAATDTDALHTLVEVLELGGAKVSETRIRGDWE